jgi:predicted tellurium resistance membrane protein TerC
VADGPGHLDRLSHPAGVGGRPRHRQRGVHLDPRREAAPRPAGPSTPDRPGPRPRHACLLLLTLSWVIGLTAPLFSLIGHEISGRDLILILGGLFLLAKSTYEIHDRLEGESGHASARVAASFAAVVAQIVVLDAVFSLDSVITAVGMVDQLGVMIAAVIVSVVIMLVSAGAISAFVNRHPTIKMLALSFLLLIGLTLLLDGFDLHIPKGYIYFAMAFSLLVELLNLRVRARPRRGEPVQLHQPYEDAT